MRNEKETLSLGQLFERLVEDARQLFKDRTNLVRVEFQERLSQVLKQIALTFLIMIFAVVGLLFLNVGLVLLLYEQYRSLAPLVLTFGGINFLVGIGIVLFVVFWQRSRIKPLTPEEDAALGNPALAGEDIEETRRKLEGSVEEGEEEIAQTISAMKERARDVVSWKKWVEDYPVESLCGALVLGFLTGHRSSLPSSSDGLVKNTLRSLAIEAAVKKLKHFLDEKRGANSSAERAPNDRLEKEEGVSHGRISK